MSWLIYRPTPTDPSVQQLLNEIRMYTEANIRPRIDYIKQHADWCEIESGASHEPHDEHLSKLQAWTNLKNARDSVEAAWNAAQPGLMAAENEIDHGGGGGMIRKKVSKKTGKKKTGRKKRPR